ncbi:FAD-dependent oxidoreductase [Sphingomicrobium sp. XHP0235]|uniref:FAD/NAD(P)-binding protein n=1 Tax=Sphingomicrobium aquimarinum TaxID=3133971 RepID=UPI0031FEB737
MTERILPVAIIGAGFSGLMVAAQLARRGVDSTLVDPRPIHGQGVAYSTSERAMLLNVPARGMSAWPDHPEDFVADEDPARFAARQEYGAYLAAIHAAAVETGHVRSLHRRSHRIEWIADRWRIHLSDGSTLDAQHVVLATGNEPPDTPSWAHGLGDAFIANPWSKAARTVLRDKTTCDLLVLGSGLTMVDAALLYDASGKRGRMTVLSRRGQIPRAHGASPPAPVEYDDIPLERISTTLRWLRNRAEVYGWRATIDALRPHSARIWQRLDGRQRRRFLRHALPWWNVHRHRLAPEIAKRIDHMRRDGRIELMAGRVLSAKKADAGGIELVISPKGASSQLLTLRVDAIINAIGPNGSMANLSNPLLQQLVLDGIVPIDDQGIGIAVDEDLSVAGQQGLWALGPPTRGTFWEATAVPDIRGQAERMAETLTRKLAH